MAKRRRSRSPFRALMRLSLIHISRAREVPQGCPGKHHLNFKGDFFDEK